MDFFGRKDGAKPSQEVETEISVADQDTPEATSSSDGEVECVHSERVVAKKPLHNRSRLNRLVALVIGMTILIGVVVGTVGLNGRLRVSRAVANANELFLSESSIALHASPTDCWVAIHGAVYDLTQYAPRHPSGPEYIWDYCGLDGTVAYDRFHTSTALLDVVAFQQMGVTSTVAAVDQDSEGTLYL